jgi:diacylglycerol O-acyltransferase
MGLFIATPSYNGEITFNVTSTRELMPDMEFFIECIDEALASLKSAVRPKKKTSAKKPAGKKAAKKKADGSKTARKKSSARKEAPAT